MCSIQHDKGVPGLLQLQGDTVCSNTALCSTNGEKLNVCGCVCVHGL